MSLGRTASGLMPGADNEDQQLEIRLAEQFDPLCKDYNLLASFHFGREPTATDHPSIVNLNLEPIGHQSLFENWWYKGEVSYRSLGSARIAECAEFAFVTVQIADTSSGNFRELTRHAYQQLLHAVRSTDHAQVIKIWNYFDEINLGNDDLEKYRQFSLGRAEIFQGLGMSDGLIPAGTAIGTNGGNVLTLVALASNRQFRCVENPRQISAFHYPRIYGPKSPQFSRAGIVSSNSRSFFVISGTAAIVGHETAHPYDIHLQVDETLENLNRLCDAATKLGASPTHFSLKEKGVLRVYLRNPEDHALVSKALNKVLGGDKHNVVFLHGNICRKELMVEIDGVKVV